MSLVRRSILAILLAAGILFPLMACGGGDVEAVPEAAASPAEASAGERESSGEEQKAADAAQRASREEAGGARKNKTERSIAQADSGEAEARPDYDEEAVAESIRQRIQEAEMSPGERAAKYGGLPEDQAEFLEKAIRQGKERAARTKQPPKHKPPAESLEEIAGQLVKAGNLRMSGQFVSRLIDQSGGVHEAFRESDGQTLLDLAQRKKIYIFAHGFELEQWGGKPRLGVVENKWSRHVNLIKQQGDPAAVAMVQHNMLDGFGDHQPQFGNLLFALRWLTDDPRLYDPEREIIVVAHSAGGNYAKNAYLLMRRNFEASGAKPGGPADTTMRFITMATPHRGSDMAFHGEAGTALYQMVLEELGLLDPSRTGTAERMHREDLIARYQEMVRSRGFMQLRPDSADLRELNEKFMAALQEAGNVEFICMAGSEDTLVPTRSAFLTGGPTLRLGHSYFLNPFTSMDSSFRKNLLQLYGYEDNEMMTMLRMLTVNPAVISTGLKSGAKPVFAIGAGDRSERSVAIEKYIHSRLLVEAPKGSLAPIADQIDAKIAAAQLPSEFMEGVDDPGWYYEIDGERAFKLYLIDTMIFGGLTEGPDRERFSRLKDEVSACFDPLLMSAIGNLWSSKPSDPNSPYARKFPEGFADRLTKPRYSGPGALAGEQIVHSAEIMRDMATNYAYEHDIEQAPQPLYVKWNNELISQDFYTVPILQCSYVPEDGSPHVRTMRYFWYKEEPAGWIEKKKELPADHPLRAKIGPPREKAPDRLADATW